MTHDWLPSITLLLLVLDRAIQYSRQTSSQQLDATQRREIAGETLGAYREAWKAGLDDLRHFHERNHKCDD